MSVTTEQLIAIISGHVIDSEAALRELAEEIQAAYENGGHRSTR